MVCATWADGVLRVALVALDPFPPNDDDTVWKVVCAPAGTFFQQASSDLPSKRLGDSNLKRSLKTMVVGLGSAQ